MSKPLNRSGARVVKGQTTTKKLLPSDAGAHERQARGNSHSWWGTARTPRAELELLAARAAAAQGRTLLARGGMEGEGWLPERHNFAKCNTISVQNRGVGVR